MEPSANILDSFKTELTRLLNTHSIDSYSDVPDYILANTIMEFIEIQTTINYKVNHATER